MLSQQFDVIVVGSGLAGLATALHLAPTLRVAVFTKRTVSDGASQWAQGGIAAVLGEEDSVEMHVNDTLVAGAGLCDLPATRFVVENAPGCIEWLRSLGVPFSLAEGQLHLTREGGHSQRRIVHVADATGSAVQQALIEAAARQPRIVLLEHHTLVDLILGQDGRDGDPVCAGVHALDERSGELIDFVAPHVVLATGGAGRVYCHTTNPPTATGDGIAAAWRAGCRVSNMEFIQFHPTALFHPQADSFLISEAVRGEGGILRLPSSAGGHRFMPDYDTRAELAPRDVVARAIDAEMKRLGLPCVHLDISHRPAAFLHEHFPNILARCAQLGIDITTQPIPVVPAAHYTCGGIVADLHARTDLPGLYAIGEAACTGLHGGNRLASNSLLECMVFARSAATAILQSSRVTLPRPVLKPCPTGSGDAAQEAAVGALQDDLRRLMWQHVGIVRTGAGLAEAEDRIRELRASIGHLLTHSRLTRQLIELRNLAQVSSLIVQSALSRFESRGAHFRTDYPAAAEPATATILAQV